jgi:hypothetical protein
MLFRPDHFEIINDKIKIKITDFGAGIPAVHKDKIFNKFVQSEVRKLGITHSTGLGLTFCKLVIKAHNQQIGVFSEIGQGSTFWFDLKISSSNISGSSNQSNELIQKIISHSNNEILETKEKLKTIIFFQIGEIFSILTCSNFTSKKFLEWKKEVEKAVLYTNKKYYNELLNFDEKI